MNRIFNRFEKILNFVLEGTKRTVKPNIRGTHLLRAVPMNRKFEELLLILGKTVAAPHTLQETGDTKRNAQNLGIMGSVPQFASFWPFKLFGISLAVE